MEYVPKRLWDELLEVCAEVRVALGATLVREYAHDMFSRYVLGRAHTVFPQVTHYVKERPAHCVAVRIHIEPVRGVVGADGRGVDVVLSKVL